jgi:YidC/Oxa1 family membrane protein insertase
MQIDRNSVIGFVLLALLFFGFFYFTQQGQREARLKEQTVKDSLAKLQPKIDPQLVKIDSLRRDTIQRLQSAGGFAQAALGVETETVVE